MPCFPPLRPAANTVTVMYLNDPFPIDRHQTRGYPETYIPVYPSLDGHCPQRSRLEEACFVCRLAGLFSAPFQLLVCIHLLLYNSYPHRPSIPNPPPFGFWFAKWFSAPCHTVLRTYDSDSSSSISWSVHVCVGRH